MWRAGLKVFFVYTGAQSILANPKYQDKKMLDIFFRLQPPPRVSQNGWLLLEGFFITGFFMAIAFNTINLNLSGNWLRKGLLLGFIAWLLVIPWFEFYLPYNVMNEPLGLVVFECLLWFGVMLLTGLCASFTLNFNFK
ncbi:MAG TPA: hypothetical protein VHS53_18525 [Mucilaginibacter sp.]|nr:hypothetical protein [Mucilaginibacter sp.]